MNIDQRLIWGISVNNNRSRIMNNLRVMSWTISITLIVLLLSGYGVTYAQPESGDWRVLTDFGEFVFTVNIDGTHITKIIYTFSSWTCGPVTLSGTISIEKEPGWPISERQFTIENTLDVPGDQTMTINGTFSETGDEASGTWSADMYGTTCSGNWGPIILSVQEVGGGIPERFVIEQNYPNPFNSNTTIQFALPRTLHVSIKVYNVLGSEVVTLVDERLPPGQYKTTWNAADFASGVYLYRIQAGDIVGTKKLILLK